MLPEAVGYIVSQHAVSFRPRFVTLHGGTKQVIQKCKVGGIVPVQCFCILTVVPVVEMG